jgi:hypothetical protein
MLKLKVESFEGKNAKIKSSQNGKIWPNLVTLTAGKAIFCQIQYCNIEKVQKRRKNVQSFYGATTLTTMRFDRKTLSILSLILTVLSTTRVNIRTVSIVAFIKPTL